MGFFATQDYTHLQVLRVFFRRLLLKMAIIALCWVGLYFFTQLLYEGAVALFNLLVGCLAGLTIGWSLAEDAVEDSGLHGVTLWVVLTVAGTLCIFGVEGIMKLITQWDIGFGRWMCMTSAIVMTMAAVVWRASADD